MASTPPLTPIGPLQTLVFQASVSCVGANCGVGVRVEEEKESGFPERLALRDCSHLALLMLAAWVAEQICSPVGVRSDQEAPS